MFDFLSIFFVQEDSSEHLWANDFRAQAVAQNVSMFDFCKAIKNSPAQVYFVCVCVCECVMRSAGCTEFVGGNGKGSQCVDCVCVCVCVCACVCVCVCVFVCVCVCVCVYDNVKVS